MVSVSTPVFIPFPHCRAQAAWQVEDLLYLCTYLCMHACVRRSILTFFSNLILANAVRNRYYYVEFTFREMEGGNRFYMKK